MTPEAGRARSGKGRDSARRHTLALAERWLTHFLFLFNFNSQALVFATTNQQQQNLVFLHFLLFTQN